MRLKDYYSTLEISPSATQGEVSHAYKRLAKKWHPDRNHSPEATVRMQEINEAYFILRDIDKRARYDSLFRSAFKARKNKSPHAQSRPNGTSDWNAHQQREPEVVDEEFEGWMNEARKWAQENMGYAATETANMIKEGAMGGLMNLVGALVFGLVMYIIFSVASC